MLVLVLVEAALQAALHAGSAAHSVLRAHLRFCVADMAFAGAFPFYAQ
jgi:hypothetical protein